MLEASELRRLITKSLDGAFWGGGGDGGGGGGGGRAFQILVFACLFTAASWRSPIIFALRNDHHIPFGKACLVPSSSSPTDNVPRRKTPNDD